MSNSNGNRTLGRKALEMVMRDVLEGLEDFAIMKSYESDDILQIVPLDTPLDHENPPATRTADVIPFRPRKR